MTTATPVPTPDVMSPWTPEVPAVAEKRRPVLIWFVVGGLLLVGGLAIVVLALMNGSDDGAALVNDHSTQAGEPALVDVPGYAYGDPSAEDVALFESMVTQGNDEAAAMLPPGSPEVYSNWSLHEVATADTDLVADLGLMRFNAQYLSGPMFNPDMVVTGVAGGMATGGATVTSETIDGETVAIAEEPEGEFTVFAWYHDGDVSMAVGDDEDAVRAFVEAYIAEQNN